MIEVG